MTESLALSFSAVVPMLMYMMIGILVRKVGIISREGLEQLNIFVFKILLATSIYYNIVSIEISHLLDGKLLLFAVCVQFIVTGFSLGIAFLAEKEKKRRGALSQCLFHTNYVIFGTLIGTSICGEGHIGVISLMIAIIAPMQNVLSVIVLETCREKKEASLRKLVFSVLKNPFIIAAIAGLLTQLLHISWPVIITGVLRDIGRCGAPVAMIVMGGLFRFDTIIGNLRLLGIGTVFRLLFIPAVFLPISIAFGFEGPALVGLMCLFIAPSATSCFNLAFAMDSDQDLTSQMVVFTSIISLGSIFMWIFLLSQGGFLTM